MNELTPEREAIKGLSPEQMREYNIKAANLLYPDIVIKILEGSAIHITAKACGDFDYTINPKFNFFTNAADKDMLLEKLEIDTFYFRDGEFWRCDNIDSGGDGEVRNKSMTTTQIACIVSCLDCDNR